MSKSPLPSIAIICVIAVAIYVSVITLNQSGAPVDLELTLSLEYQGTSIGSTDLKYHWLSGEVSQESEFETIEWQDRTVTASALSYNSIDSTIIEYLGEASQSGSWLSIDEDGYWTVSFTLLVGGSLPIYLIFSGKDTTVNDVSLSSDASFLPTALKTALKNLGITSLDLILGWNLVISGDFLRSWFSNLFDFIRDGISTIRRIGSSLIGSIELE